MRGRGGRRVSTESPSVRAPLGLGLAPVRVGACQAGVKGVEPGAEVQRQLSVFVEVDDEISLLLLDAIGEIITYRHFDLVVAHRQQVADIYDTFCLQAMQDGRSKPIQDVDDEVLHGLEIQG